MKKREDGRAERILDYVHLRYREPLTNASVGAEFGFHPNYVSERIRVYTGMPLHQYLLRVRLSHALELQEYGDHGIGEIAVSCGFCDIYYFSAYFKKVMGVSPSAYQKSRKENKRTEDGERV